uniref:Uncharacterized protein n=1 Tax=Oryza meridionalis TaxID=40149 RepID=A0A0E0F699_9ORYZ
MKMSGGGQGHEAGGLRPDANLNMRGEQMTADAIQIHSGTGDIAEEEEKLINDPSASSIQISGGVTAEEGQDIDPHYAILATDVEEHEKLYDIGYDPCYPNERTDRDNVKSTKRALEMYMHMLENSGSSVLPVAEAKWKVLQAEALHEVEFHRSDAIRQFSSELDVCANKLALILEKMEPAVTRPSLIGVIGPGQGIM